MKTSKYTPEDKHKFADEIEGKLKSIAIRCIDLYKKLPANDFVAQHIGKQLVRSGTSSATNYRAVRRSRSQNEFYAKISIVIEELDESIFWLEILIELLYFSPEKLSNLISDSKSILAILSVARKTPNNSTFAHLLIHSYTHFVFMQKIKVGIVGTGFIGPAHIEALRRLPNIEVTALCEVNIELAKAKAEQLGIERAYIFDDLLKQDDIACIHICTPNFLHYSQSKAALLAGKHVVCEKPLAKDLHEAEELVAIAAQTGLINAVHFNLRYYPLIRQMKAMRENGDLGEVYSIIGSYLQDWLFYATDYNWRLEPDKSGDSRAIADIGSHLMDVLEYITGLKTVEVMADFNTIHKTRKKPLKPVETYSGKMLTAEDYADVSINTEDHANVLLRFDNGNRGSITVSQVSAGRKNQLKLEIAGANKTFAWNSESPNNLWVGYREKANEVLMRDPSLVHADARSLITFPGGHNEGFPDTSKQLFKEVYEAVAAGKQPENPSYPTFADGYRELLICERILDSNKKQGWVRV